MPCKCCDRRARTRCCGIPGPALTASHRRPGGRACPQSHAQGSHCQEAGRQGSRKERRQKCTRGSRESSSAANQRPPEGSLGERDRSLTLRNDKPVAGAMFRVFQAGHRLSTHFGAADCASLASVAKAKRPAGKRCPANEKRHPAKGHDSGAGGEPLCDLNIDAA